MFEIKTDKPVPAVRKHRGRSLRFPFDKLTPGSYFFVDRTEFASLAWRRADNSLRVLASAYGKRSGVPLTVRAAADQLGWEVWRLA